MNKHSTIGQTLALAASFCVLVACGDDSGMTAGIDSGTAPGQDSGTPAPDGAADGATAADSITSDALGTDALPAGCTEITFGSWNARVDDVSAKLWAPVSPELADMPHVMNLLFQRFTPEPDIGTFVLGEGFDANIADCRHCVFASTSASPDKIFFATEGTMTQRSDPYSLRFDLTVDDLVLREAEVSSETGLSTLVPGGACAVIETFTVQDAFPGPTWRCGVGDFADGVSCHCNCGAFDPDCSTGFIGDEPLPVADCPESTVCGFDPIARLPECTLTCDWEERVACGTDATCVFDYGHVGASTCIDEESRLSVAGIGGECEGGGLQRFCAVEDGFANGYCDAIDICRAICVDDAECTGVDESCHRFIGDAGLGFCGPPPPKDG